MIITKIDYKKEDVGKTRCRNHPAALVDYTLRTKAEGGVFDNIGDGMGICEVCYSELPEPDIQGEIRLTKSRFIEMIAYLRSYPNREKRRRVIAAYKKRLALLKTWSA